MTAHYEVPQTQNTAPVIEYRCLYTTDLTRKQKRWQDGKLRFHTFNKRIMVYDERSNYVGDSHWRQDYDFAEGEELKLERGGTLVQVEEQMEVVNQDLSELLTKRQKEKERRAAAISNASPNPAGRIQNFGTPSHSLKSKSLNAMLTPSGHHGRAVVSTTSPFEERQRLSNGNHGNHENERPPKRRKPDESPQAKSGYAQQLTGTKLTLASSKPSSTPTIRYEPFNRPTISHKPKSTIDLTLDDDTEDTGSTPPESVSRDDVLKQKKEKAKAQRLKRPRSPPPKSTYASNLTGVALMLNRPAPTSSLNRPSKKAAPQIPMHEHSEPSSEKDDSDKEGVHQPEPEPKKDLPKARNPSIQKKKAPRIESEKLARPSVDIASARSSSKPGRTLPDSSVEPQNKSVPERPLSSLRIKSRPPRRMMMCMERPSSRASGNGESNGWARTKSSLSNSFSDNSEPAQSQATIRLEAYARKQDEKLQARLNGKRPRLNLDLDDFTSSPLVSDPPFDSGMNYQDIDRRLSPKCLSEMTKSHPIAELAPTRSTARDFRGEMTANSGNKISFEDIFENGTSDSDTILDEYPKVRVPASRSRLNRDAQQKLSSKPPTPKSNTPPQAHRVEIPPNLPRSKILARDQEMSCVLKESRDTFVDGKLSDNSPNHAFGIFTKFDAEGMQPTKHPKINTPPKTVDPTPQPAKNPSPSKELDLITSPEADNPPDKVVKANVLPNGICLQDLFLGPVEGTKNNHKNVPKHLDQKSRLGEPTKKANDVVKTSPITRANEPVNAMDVVSAQSPGLTERTTPEGNARIATKSNVIETRDNTDNRLPSAHTSVEAAKIVKTSEKPGVRDQNPIKMLSKTTSPPTISPEALQAPIAHFRSIVQSASTSVMPVEEQPPTADTGSAVQLEPVVYVPADSQRREAVPDLPPEEDSNLAEPVPVDYVPTARPNVRPLNTSSFRFMHNAGGPVGQSFDSSGGSNDMVLSIAAMKNQPKFKLSKPTPTIMSSRPPVPAFSVGKNNVENAGQRRERRPVTATGPWSKESFDLFGDWGPLV